MPFFLEHRYPLFISMVSFLLLLMTSSLAAAQNDNPLSIRLNKSELNFLKKRPLIIAIDDSFYPLMFIDENKKPAGLIVDIWRLWAEKTGVPIIFQAGSWSDSVKGVQDGSADVHSGLFETPERSEWMAFSEPFYGIGSALFYSSATTPIQQLSDLRNEKVGAEFEAYQGEYLRDQGLNVVEFTSTEEMIRATLKGRIRAFLAEALPTQIRLDRLELSGGIESSGDVLFSNMMHAGILKKQKELLKLINKGFKQIELHDLAEIERRWISYPGFRFYGRQNEVLKSGVERIYLKLTDKELEWIRSHPVVRFTSDPGWLPFEGFSTRGNYEGISAEILKIIESMTGLTIERIPSKSWTAALQASQNYEVDMISDDLSNIALNQTHQYTEAFLEMPLSIVMRSEQTDLVTDLYSLAGKKIGVVGHYGYLWALRAHYPDIQFDVSSKSIEEGLFKVVNGDLDVLIVTYTAGSYQINQLGITDLRIVGSLPVNMRLGLAVRNDWPELHSILSKAIASIPPAEVNKIIDTWMDDKFIEHMNYELVWKTGAAAALIVFFLLFWNATVQRQKKKLLASEERFRLAMAAASDGIWDWNIVTGKTYYSQGYLQMLGYSDGEWPQEARAWREHLHPDDVIRAVSYLEHAIASNYLRFEQEFRMLHKDGHYLVILSKGSIVETDDKGIPQRAVGTHSDITLIKDAENALKEAKDIAEKTSRFKSEFLANMSHEVRTPLNAIMGMTRLTLQTELAPRQYMYVSNIDKASRNLMHVINDILDFSKIEAGRLELEHISFSLQQVLENLKNVSGVKAEEKGIELHFDIDQKIPAILLGDPMRLAQVLINLTNNGIKFTEHGQVTIAVIPNYYRNKKIELNFSISDTGIGISADKFKILFESFTQADGSTTRRYGGTGLGLSICRSLVHMMGGEIHVRSQLNKGSCFQFTLIFDVPDQAGLAMKDDSIEARALAKIPDLSDFKALVVDDNSINQLVAQELLQQAGVSVTIVDNGRNALECLHQSIYHVVLVDLQMPGMDGFETTRAIRSHDQWADLPVIAMTAHAMKGDREKCLAAGMNDHIPKPVDPKHLYATLSYWLLKQHPDDRNTLFNSEMGHLTGQYIDAKLELVDIQAGLARIDGNRPFYLKLLQEFFIDHQNDHILLQQMYQKRDYESAWRILHTLKSVAGTIGASKLEDAATELEAFFRKELHDIDFKNFNSVFEQTMHMLALEVNRFMGESLLHTAVPDVIPDLDQQLQRLHDLLVQGNTEAQALFNTCKIHLMRILPVEKFKEFEDYIEYFDFDKAAEILNFYLK